MTTHFEHNALMYGDDYLQVEWANRPMSSVWHECEYLATGNRPRREPVWYLLNDSFAMASLNGVSEEELRADYETYKELEDARHRAIDADRRFGYVYLLWSEYGHKIGKTKDVAKRMKAFYHTIPVPTRCAMICETKDRHRLEILSHELFPEKRVRGEWFDLNEDDLIWLQEFWEANGTVTVYS